MHLSPLSVDSERVADDLAIRNHMITFLEDKGVDEKRPFQTYFRHVDKDTVQV